MSADVLPARPSLPPPTPASRPAPIADDVAPTPRPPPSADARSAPAPSPPAARACAPPKPPGAAELTAPPPTTPRPIPTAAWAANAPSAPPSAPPTASPRAAAVGVGVGGAKRVVAISALMPYAAKPRKAVSATGSTPRAACSPYATAFVTTPRERSTTAAERGGRARDGAQTARAAEAERRLEDAAIAAAFEGAAAGVEPGPLSALGLAKHALQRSAARPAAGEPAAGGAARGVTRTAVVTAAVTLTASSPWLLLDLGAGGTDRPPAEPPATLLAQPPATPTAAGAGAAAAAAAAAVAARPRSPLAELSAAVGDMSLPEPSHALLEAMQLSGSAVGQPRPPPGGRGDGSQPSPRARGSALATPRRTAAAELEGRADEAAALSTAIANETLTHERLARDELDAARRIGAMVAGGAGTLRQSADEETARRRELERTTRRLDDTQGRVSQLELANAQLKSFVDEARKQRKPFLSAMAQLRARTEQTIADGRRARRAAHEALDDREHTQEILAKVKMDAAEMAKAHRLELERLGTRLESLDDKLVHTRSALEVGLEADRRASYLAVRAARDERRRLEVRLGFLAARAAECALPLERLAAISGVTIEPCLDEEGGLDARASGVQSLLERFHAKEERIGSLTAFWELQAAELHKQAAETARTEALLAAHSARVDADAAARARRALASASARQRLSESVEDHSAFEASCAELFAALGCVHELLACRTSRVAAPLRRKLASSALSTTPAEAASLSVRAAKLRAAGGGDGSGAASGGAERGGAERGELVSTGRVHGPRVPPAAIGAMLNEIGDAVAGLCARALALKRLAARHRPHALFAPELRALADAQEGALIAGLDADERARLLTDLRELLPDIHIGHADAPLNPADLIIGKARRAQEGLLAEVLMRSKLAHGEALLGPLHSSASASSQGGASVRAE